MSAHRAAVTLLALSLAACSRPGPSPSGAASDPARPLPSPVPEVVARVNGRPIRIQQILAMAKAELDRVPVAEREKRKPEVVRGALDRYIDRELLLQEALARGVQADKQEVDWTYDQMRSEHPDDASWTEFLKGQGMEPQGLRAELRAQLTVAALLEQEKQAGRDPDALAPRLRAKARVELFL